MKPEEGSRSERFIEEGLWRYEEAKTTVVAFERFIRERIKSVLEQYRKEHQRWGRFIPSKDGKIKHSTPGPDYAWLSAYLPGEIQLIGGKKEKDSVDLGIIWYTEHWPVYYVSYFNQNVPLVNPSPTPPVEVHQNRLKLRAEKDGLSIYDALVTLLNEFSKVC